MTLVPRMLFVSATPGEEELRLAGGVVVEQIIRPTGLVDPEVEVRPVKGQVDDLLHEIRLREKQSERVLVTTLTKRMSEDLTDYYRELGVRSDASQAEIAATYRALAKALHPDARPTDPAAAERFKRVTVAYRVLADVGTSDHAPVIATFE